MNASRWVMAAGVLLFVVGLRLGWLEGSFGSVPVHQLLGIGGWIYLVAVPLAFAPLAPPSWLLPLGGLWLLTLLPAAYVGASAGEVWPAWPYGGDTESVHPGLYVSVGGVVVVLGSVWWALGSESGPLPTRRWLVVLGAALVAVAAFPLSDDLRFEDDEDRIERRLARENPDASDIDVVCRGEINGGPNCATWIDDGDGGGGGSSLTRTR